MVWTAADRPDEISIHALREEGDGIAVTNSGYIVTFLSTPSARRATHRQCGERQLLHISIHALREEGDFGCAVVDAVIFIFLSTPSARRATSRTPAKNGLFSISIHALREEGDSKNREKIPAFGLV